VKTKVLLLMLLATVVYGQDTLKFSGAGWKNYGSVIIPPTYSMPNWLNMDVSIGEIKVKGWMAKKYFLTLTDTISISQDGNMVVTRFRKPTEEDFIKWYLKQKEAQ
jgi:hypothetical protein